MPHNIQCRLARREDLAEVIELIEALADFEQNNGEPKLSLEDMVRSFGFDSTDDPCKKPDMAAVVAEDLDVSNNNGTGKRLVGSNLLILGYSARSGKTLQLRHIFVRDTHRSAGVGRALLRATAEYAGANGCRLQENHVHDYNEPAARFYERMGMVNMTRTEDLYFHEVYLDVNYCRTD